MEVKWHTELTLSHSEPYAPTVYMLKGVVNHCPANSPPILEKENKVRAAESFSKFNVWAKKPLYSASYNARKKKKKWPK